MYVTVVSINPGVWSVDEAEDRTVKLRKVLSCCGKMDGGFYGRGHICYGIMTGVSQMEHEV